MKYKVRSGALLLKQGLCFHASKTPYKPLYACVRYKSSVPLTTSYVHSVGSWSLHEKTVGQLLDAADRNYGKREAVVSVHQGIRKTFSEARLEADQLAAGFLAHGLQRGDRIGIWGSNTYEWYLTQYAAAKAGLILVNINPGYRLEELKFCLNKVRVKALVCDEKFKTSNYYEMLCQLAPELLDGQEELLSNQLPHLKRVIIVADKQLRGAHRFQDVCNAGDSNHMREVEELSHKIQFDEPCNIQFTSGTTGQPKAATLSHHMIVNNAFNVGNRCGYGLNEHRICMTVPLYHCFGCVLGSLNGAHFGATCVFPSPGFDPQAAVQAMQDERVTSCYGTPTMFVDILNAQRSNQRDMSSLSTGIMSGAPCPQELVLAIINEMNMKDILVMYGMTETSPVTFQCYPTDPVSVRSSTIGYPSDHTEVKIIDEEGRVTPTGIGGELCIRGYCTFLGYWDDTEKTKEMLQEDRWLKTGDLAILQPDGYGRIIGRIKDMIIRGGENLFPAEIENFLMGHPEVLEAQVFGIPDSRMGEEAVAWIRSAQNSTLTEESLKLWCKGKIAHFKIPKHIIFKEEFPRTVTGKIQKFVMRNITTKELQLK